MYNKLVKWSKVLKWLILLLIFLRGVPVIYQLSDAVKHYNYSQIESQQMLLDKISEWINVDASESIVFKEDAVKIYHTQFRNFLRASIVEESMLFIILMIGYLVIRDISKGHIFNEKIYMSIRVIGTIISIGGIIIPTIGNESTQLEILCCPIDIYQVALGISIIVLSYVIRHGQFLQEEYDTTL